ncbi:MAG: NADPH:quinone oxidoreductase family protein [Nocardioidaceae bacterium]
MRAVQIVSLDGPSAVRVSDVDDATATDDQILVEVHAAGVSFPEVLQSRGLYQHQPPLPFVPGSEVAGVVRLAPKGAEVRAGDRVVALPIVGGFAELAVASVGMVFPLPDRVSFAAGAALPLNYLTAHFALARRGRLARGETVLVHGAAGGVGTASIQVAKAWRARVIAVCSTPARAAVARAAGADEAVLVDGFRDSVAELTGGRGADIVIDPVGGDRFTDSLRSLAPEGRLLVIGFAGGEIPTVRVNRLLLNNIEVTGVGWGAFALARPGFVADQWAALVPHVESGALDPPLGTAYPLEHAGDALAELDERRAVGKVTLTVR